MVLIQIIFLILLFNDLYKVIRHFEVLHKHLILEYIMFQH